jgi:hypothetical protein
VGTTLGLGAQRLTAAASEAVSRLGVQSMRKTGSDSDLHHRGWFSIDHAERF